MSWIQASVEGLRVVVGATGQEVLRGVSFTVAPGEVVGLAGETGSGKTTLGLSLLGYTGSGLRVSEGTVQVLEHDMLGAPNLRELRGDVVSYVPQDPASALSPGLRIGESFSEVLSAHGIRDAAEQAARRADLFSAVGLPADEPFARRYPHELSGGQQQRVAIAIAFALRPRLVVMDEPTTGLDVTTKQKVVELVRRLSGAYGSSVVFISHDLRLLLSCADRIVVLYDGEIVEDAPAAGLLEGAEHPYTRRLLAALPRTDGAAAIAARSATALLAVESMSARYGIARVTHDVSFELAAGECVALVGESGSGKTTTARSVAGLHAQYDGRVVLDGAALAHDVVRRTRAQKKAVQYVFQNPFASLNPRRTIGGSIEVAARLLGGHSRSGARAEAERLMAAVGLRADHLLALPHQLSGGQRQRAALARALAVGPAVLVCDEVTSSLDVSVQAEIMDLLADLQRDTGLAMLFITHDLGLARSIAGTTLVLLSGEVVEQGPTAQVLSTPQHEYTATLVAEGAAAAR